MASQSFNARGGISVGLTGTSVISETGFGTFPVGITVSGITLNGTIISSGLGTFNAGITASGATFMGSINLQNAEFIRNTTNGQMDFMPAPSSATAFGLYMDMTSWTYGVIMGTVRSSDGAKNTGGNFRFDVPLTVLDNTLLQMGSDGHYGLYRSTAGNDTGQLRVTINSANSGAWAIVDSAGTGLNNRSPGTTHSNPNLYIYAAGAANANDFIRTEHDRTNANIVTGQTSGILMQPGSGWLGVSGGISASGGITFAGTVQLFGLVATGATAPTIASASTIAPTKSVTFVSGVTTINTITAPAGIAAAGGQITIIPTGLWSTGTSGNIALATTAVVNKALIMVYDAQTTKWYPSY